MEDSKRSGAGKILLVLMIILIGAIIFIYASLRPTLPKNEHTKSENTSQQAAQNKSGSQDSSSKSGSNQGKQTATSSSSGSSNNASSQNLANSGPGDVVALFLFAVAFGYTAHRSYIMRASKQGGEYDKG